MTLSRRLERLERIHRFIKFRRTGPPEQLAARLGVSVSLTYRLIRQMRELGAPIRYNHWRQTYEYSRPTEPRFGFFPPAETPPARGYPPAATQKNIAPPAGHHPHSTPS